MTQACAYPVALIVAPAGYGKTVALRQYLESVDSPQVRFDVRPEHETLPGFVRGFAESAAAFAPEMRTAMGDALRRPSTAAQLAEWAATHLREFHGIIAIDDLHLAAEDDILVFLQLLVEWLKGSVRWIFASRSMPQLPVATWMTYGDMDIAVDEHDLAFTVDEAKSAGREADATEEELRRFIEMTGGWATALSFAMRSRVRTGELEAIGRTTREMVYRYLAEQVYEQLSDIERNLLHIAAYMPSIEVELLEAAGFPDAHALLEQLRKRTAFLSVEGRRSYRCHDLFRDFLRHQVELMGFAVELSIRSRVAAVLEKSGATGNALSLYIDCGAWTPVARILEESGLDLIDRGESDVVRLALAAISHTETFHRPSIVGVRAWAEYTNGTYDAAERLFRMAIADCNDDCLKDRLTLGLAQLLYNQGDEASDLLEAVVRTGQTEDARLNARAWLAAHYARKGAVDSAKRMLYEALERIGHAATPMVAARTFLRTGMAALVLELESPFILDLFRQAHEIASRQGFFSVAAAALSGLSNVHLIYEDDPNTAMYYAVDAQAMAALSGDRFHIEISTVRIAHIAIRLGDREKLSQCIAALQRFASSNRQLQPFVSELLEIAAAWNGDFELATRNATASNDLSMHADRIFSMARHSLYFAATGRREDAGSLVMKTLEALSTAQFSVVLARRQAECARLLCAIVHGAGHRRSAARRVLRSPALANAPYLHILTRVAELYASGEDLRGEFQSSVGGLLKRLHDEGCGGLALILQAFFKRVNTSDCTRACGLTASELDVLRKLDLGLAPKQIAAESGRSVHTVRTLVQRAVTKLGCSGRQEALAAARGAGLLDGNFMAAIAP